MIIDKFEAYMKYRARGAPPTGFREYMMSEAGRLRLIEADQSLACILTSGRFRVEVDAVTDELFDALNIGMASNQWAPGAVRVLMHGNTVAWFIPSVPTETRKREFFSMGLCRHDADVLSRRAARLDAHEFCVGSKWVRVRACAGIGDVELAHLVTWLRFSGDIADIEREAGRAARDSLDMAKKKLKSLCDCAA